MGMTDFDAVIRGWAGRQARTVGNTRGPSENIPMEVDWSKVRQSTVKTTFTTPVHQQQGGGTPRSQIVFTSNYDNNTDEVQNHTFQMDRATEATVKTFVTKGFSKNGNVDIHIDVPQVVSDMTGGFGSDIVVASEDQSTVKHAVSWGLNSTVKAQPNKRTIAELRITEIEHHCTFEAEVNIRGRVFVRVNNGGSTQVVEGDIATILKDELNDAAARNDGMVSIQGRKVTWKVAGGLRFKFGVSQDVKVKSEKLPPQLPC
ncbi:uncharacterized protein [Haliotis cracherodii]|uniref:uncharacterized protein n=1 Tax=Haliotis cracherodii TaxID=6455 RepID=UPI0039EA5E71